MASSITVKKQARPRIPSKGEHQKLLSGSLLLTLTANKSPSGNFGSEFQNSRY